LKTFGRTENVVFIDPKTEHAEELAHNHDSPSKFHMFFHKYNFSEFFKRPILHQWLQDGKVFREAKERVSSRFELFFDLLFVGIVHQIAESAAEHADGLGLAKFIPTFSAAFSVWGDVRDLENQFANEDVISRVYLLWIMALLVGYSNNASSVILVPISQSMDKESSTALHWALGFLVLAKMSRGKFSYFLWR
jgi:hypothetical protein